MSKPQHHGRRRLPPVAALAVVLLLVGAALLAGVLRNQHHAPQPPASAAVPFQPGATGSAGSAAVPPSATAPSSRRPSGPTLRRALPLHLSIPNIGVESDLLQLGLNPDRPVQVPPLSRHSEAGWYPYSPAPGQLGPSVILGHVDS